MRIRLRSEFSVFGFRFSVFGFRCAVRGNLKSLFQVPKARQRIAPRFNVGLGVSRKCEVPDGTTSLPRFPFIPHFAFRIPHFA